VLALLVAGCSKANFKGNTPEIKIAPVEVEKTFNIACDDEYGKRYQIEAQPNEIVRTKVTGTFCPVTDKKLTVYFVVDFSGSMGLHTPIGSNSRVPGNDPQINGTCGRLQSAQAILNKLRDELDYGDDVRVGLIPFAGEVFQDRVQSPTDVDIFESYLVANQFCSYVVQDSSYGQHPQNPGGIIANNQSSVNSSTNYKAAFDAAYNALRSTEGRKIVYFISDGEPTSGGFEPLQSGIAAGQQLLSLNETTVNALLLGSDEVVARDALIKIVGDSQKVRVAAKAGELATEILKFPESELPFNSSSAQLFVSGIEKPLQLKTLLRSEGNKWAFETDYFTLFSLGEFEEHNVQIRAEATDGKEFESSVIIDFKQ